LLKTFSGHRTMNRPLLSGLMLSAALLATPAHAWWNADWTERAKVTLDTTDKGMSLPSAQTDVVVPVRLHSGNFDFTQAAPDGADLRVVGGDDKTPLPFEIERFDSINELAVLWVRLPAVAQGSDKNLIHVYGGHAKAPAEARQPVFANGFAAVLHFSEADGPLKDASAGLASTSAVEREPNGLLGGALRATGKPVALPLNGRLHLAANGALTVSMWVRPEPGNGPSTLLALGPLKLARAVDEVLLQVDGKKLAAAALPASAWTHVALTVAAGKATLYVNGQASGQVDSLLPDATPDLVLADGFQGQIDEVQVLPAARDEGWVRIAAAAQGADGKLVHALKEGADAEAGGEGGSTSYFGVLLKNLTTDAWVVIIILMIMFAIAAWVMVSKALLVSRMAKANDQFLARFRASSAARAVAEEPVFQGSTLWQLYQVGSQEVGKRQAQGIMALSGANLDAIKATLDATLVRQNQTLNARMVLLTIAISGGPFLGLLGTVVGVMITFAAIAAAGDVNVNAIAPGIAAALLATVAGLGVAIPALFGYNWLAAQIKNISSDMQIFVDEFVTRAAEAHGQS
jgi:biopolymer transport protein ExbB